MKTRYKILVAVSIASVGLMFFPPILIGVCDSLGIYDDTCPRISGVQIPFGGPVYLWNTIPAIPNECWTEDENGDIVECRIETGWPFALTPAKDCDEICGIVDHQEMAKIKDEIWCAKKFDEIFDTWQAHVEENYGGPGQPTLEPPTVAGLIASWEGGESFRESDCRFTVNDWAYLVEHQDEVWGHVDWPKLEPFR